MTDDLTIRQYQEGDEKAIVMLLELAFGGWPNFDLKCTPLEHWQWKYRDNPQKRTIVSIAERNKKIVGCLHAFPYELKLGERTANCLHVGDLAVHPNSKGLKIVSKLESYIEDFAEELGFDSMMSFTLDSAVATRYKKKHKQDYFPHQPALFVKTINIDLLLKTTKQKNALIKKRILQGLIMHNRIWNFFSKLSLMNEKSYNVDIIEIEKFDERITHFWNKIKDYYSFIVERNQEYLNWRYCDSRGGEYLIKIAEDNGKILGVIVLKKKDGKQNLSANAFGYIVDLLTLPNRLDVANALLAKSIYYFNKESVNLIQSLMIKNHPYEREIRKHDFFNSRIRLFVNYLSLDKEIKIEDISSSPEEIHLQYGDTDWI